MGEGLERRERTQVRDPRDGPLCDFGADEVEGASSGWAEEAVWRCGEVLRSGMFLITSERRASMGEEGPETVRVTCKTEMEQREDEAESAAASKFQLDRLSMGAF